MKKKYLHGSYICGTLGRIFSEQKLLEDFLLMDHGMQCCRGGSVRGSNLVQQAAQVSVKTCRAANHAQRCTTRTKRFPLIQN